MKTLAAVLCLRLSMCAASHAGSLPKKFWGAWCSVPTEDAPGPPPPQMFQRKRANADCTYGWKISRTAIRSWDGSDKCRIGRVDGHDASTLFVLGKGERPCFSAGVWREKRKTLLWRRCNHKMGRSIKTLIFVAVMIVGVLLAIPIITHANEPERCTQRLAPLSNKPLTQKQFREYKELRRIGLTKKDAAQAARDPGVTSTSIAQSKIVFAFEMVLAFARPFTSLSRV
jgi:hypothetical protein